MSDIEKTQLPHRGLRWFSSDANGALKVVLRFPVTVIFLMAVLIAVESNVLGLFKASGAEWWAVAFGGAALASLAAALFAEARSWRAVENWALSVICGAVAFTLLKFSDTFLTDPVMLIGALIAAILVAPFIGRGGSSSHWFYLWNAVVAIILTAAAALVIVGGLTFILWSIESLFGISRLSSRAFEHIMPVTVLFIAPLFGLSMAPVDFNETPEIDADRFDVRALRLLADWVAAPMLLAYALVLHLYAVRVLINGGLPQGQVGALVLTYGICIVAGIIFMQPLWGILRAPARLLARIWPWLLVVPLVMLFLAVFRRISDYGVTPERYLLLLFGLVLAVVAACQLFKRTSGDTRLMALVPTAVLLAASFGPQGALGVSLGNQASRFMMAVKTSPMTDLRREQAQSALYFLGRYNALERATPPEYQKSPQYKEFGQSTEGLETFWNIRTLNEEDTSQSVTLRQDFSPSVAYGTEGFDSVFSGRNASFADYYNVEIRLPTDRLLKVTISDGKISTTHKDTKTLFSFNQNELTALTARSSKPEAADASQRGVVRLSENGKVIEFLLTNIEAVRESPDAPLVVRRLEGALLLRSSDWND